LEGYETLKGDFLDFFFLCMLFNTLLHLPSLRFHCVRDAGIET
jgi:hypothetical protein